MPDAWILTTTAPALHETVPHVWQVDLNHEQETAITLDAGERARAQRLATPLTRVRFVRAHKALRKILGEYLHADASSVRFEIAERGKPRVIQSDVDGPRLTFSLSHAEDIALVAVGIDAPLGVDVERVRPFAELSAVVTTHFSAEEYAELAGSEPAAALHAFYRCWTRKEAVLKALGTGLHESPSSISVECTLTRRPRLRSIPRKYSSAPSWSLIHLEPCSEYIGALATPRPLKNVQLLRLTT